jgi:hypothetical protein
MVLEYLLGYEIKKPVQLFLTGIFYSSIAIFIAAVLFFRSPSMVIVTFMTLPTVYIFARILHRKSFEQLKVRTFPELLEVNSDLVEMYTFLFLGMVTGIALWFSILPSELAAAIFSEQIYHVHAIAETTAAAVTSSQVYLIIAANNIKLVLLCTVLSFIFASGALFLLAWNATIVGVVMGMLTKKLQAAGMGLVAALGKGLTLGFAYYILHLVPEIVAYFTATIGGAMISSAVMRYKPFGSKSRKLMLIAAGLVSIAIALILLAVAIEIHLSRAIQLGLGL